jgi:hypothetical protein
LKRRINYKRRGKIAGHTKEESMKTMKLMEYLLVMFLIFVSMIFVGSVSAGSQLEIGEKYYPELIDTSCSPSWHQNIPAEDRFVPVMYNDAAMLDRETCLVRELYRKTYTESTVITVV